jgi:hypothetical protein
MFGVLFHGYCYFNVMMSNGKHGNLEYSSTKEIKMNKLEPVAKISVYQFDTHDYI